MSIQEEIAKVITRFLNINLQSQGIMPDLTFKFKKQRIRDRKEIAETEKIQIENITTKEDRNYITPDEAKEEIKQLRDPLTL